MVPGPFGWPLGGARSEAYRFLDTTGLPRLAGDVARFTPAHVRVDPGDPLPGVWRPKPATAQPTLSVERGCLVVTGATATAVAAHMAAPADVDVVFEALPALPFRDTSMVYTVGIYVDVGGVGHLAAVNLRSDTCVTISEGAATRNVPVAVLRKGNVDLSDPGLPVVLGSLASIYQDFIGLQPAVFFRFKRSTSASACATYYSIDGYNWKALTTIAGPMSASSIGVYGNATGDLGPTPKINVAGVKFLDPTTAFPG